MKHFNFLETEMKDDIIHGGSGLCHHGTVVSGNDFDSPIRFLNYTILPSGARFGMHKHGNDNELYIVLEGRGHYYCNDECVPCKTGDVLVNPPYGTHAIENDSPDGKDMRILVLEAYNA